MSFEGIVKKISPTLKRIAYRLGSHCSFLSGDDLYQEAIIHLWEGFQAGKLQGNTDSYILQGCYFYLKNYLRKIKPKAQVISLEAASGEEGADLERALSKDAPDTAAAALRSKIWFGDLQNNGFTEKEKEIISFCAEGLTVRQMGRKLGISHAGVIKIKNSLRKKVKSFEIKP